MQEIQSIGGGRFFAGGAGGGDRRMRPHHQQNHQALKCPRCDSLNTKFCYYNNYNLSQPRHFCKSCRRYWTKGGVLRNVPVGGGCRKSKRSKPKNSTPSSTDNTICSSPPATAAADTPAPPPAPSQQELKSNSHSSSESSSLTAANTASAITTEAISAPTQNPATNTLLSMHESKFLVNGQSGIPNFEAGLLEQAAESGIFSEIGSFTSLITSTSEALPFGFGNMTDASPFRFTQQGSDHLVEAAGQNTQWPQQQKGTLDPQGLKFPEITCGSMLEQTVQVDSSDLQNKTATAGSGFGSLDWQGVGDQGLFDLANPVDQTYWTHNQWAEHDHASLYLP